MHMGCHSLADPVILTLYQYLLPEMFLKQYQIS